VCDKERKREREGEREREREREFVDKQHIDVSFVASEVSSFDSSAN
jgi:hypothetical protein